MTAQGRTAMGMGLGDTAPSGRISRTTAFAAAMLTVGAALSACSGSSSPAAGANATAAVGDNNATTDAQIVSALTLTAAALNAAYSGSGSTAAAPTFVAATPDQAAEDAMGITALTACQADMDTADKKASVKPNATSVEYFKAATPTGDKWVRSDVTVYASIADADAALKYFGSFASTIPRCSGPTLASAQDKANPYVHGIGNTAPSWYAPPAFSPPTVVVVDVKAKTALSVVAQVRGRFIVVTYAPGSYSLTQGGTYYAVKPSDDTTAVASAATAALSQLTDAVVSH